MIVLRNKATKDTKKRMSEKSFVLFSFAQLIIKANHLIFSATF